MRKNVCTLGGKDHSPEELERNWEKDTMELAA